MPLETIPCLREGGRYSSLAWLARCKVESEKLEAVALLPVSQNDTFKSAVFTSQLANADLFKMEIHPEMTKS